jgi:hypothetical protein
MTRDTTSYAYGEVAMVAGDERAHLHRDRDVGVDADRVRHGPQVGAEEADTEAPAEGHRHHQLGRAGDDVEGARQDGARDQGGEHADDRRAEERQHDRRHRWVGEARLQGQEDDGPDVLEDEEPDAEAPRHGVEQQVLLQVLHDEQGRREGTRHAEVQGRIDAADRAPAGEPDPQERRKGDAERHRHLDQAGHHQRPAARQQARQVDLEADDEQQQGQAEVRDGVDARAVLDHLQAGGPEHHAGAEQGRDGRDAQPHERDREDTGGDQAEAEVGDQRRHPTAGAQDEDDIHRTERRRPAASRATGASPERPGGPSFDRPARSGGLTADRGSPYPG